MAMLGVKWSPIAPAVLDLVDCIEAPGWDLNGLPPGLPLLLHNLDLDFSLASPGAIDDSWVERARTMIYQTGTPWLSMHLGFSAEIVRFNGHMLPVSASLERETVWSRSFRALKTARDGIQVPLLIENLDYCPEGAYEHVCEPVFIREMAEALDCGLLLDLAHARVSADWLGYEIEEYLQALPLRRVVEIHLSSPRRIGERLDDSHEELTTLDERLLAGILQETDPAAVVIEYVRDVESLRSQLGRVGDLIAEHRQR
jgi:uncharacterized protein